MVYIDEQLVHVGDREGDVQGISRVQQGTVPGRVVYIYQAGTRRVQPPLHLSPHPTVHASSHQLGQPVSRLGSSRLLLGSSWPEMSTFFMTSRVTSAFCTILLHYPTKEPGISGISQNISELSTFCTFLHFLFNSADIH